MGRAILTLALLLGVALPAYAAETPIPPAPTRWVTDQAGLLSDETRRALDARLERYEQATGRQVIVWIGTTLGDSPLEEWVAKAFSAWGIGRRGEDDGVAIFVFPADRRMRIEVGYGLEHLLPDAYASRIVREVMAPALAAGDPDAALTGAVDQVLLRLGDEPGGTAAAPLEQRPPEPRGGSGILGIVFGAIALIVMLVLFVTNPRLAMLLFWSLIASGRRGGGFGGGGFGGGGFGGFAGGGGRSGGGGASGSW